MEQIQGPSQLICRLQLNIFEKVAFAVQELILTLVPQTAKLVLLESTTNYIW